MKILSCVCEHEFQDAEYGYRKRLCTGTSKLNVYRCTVCGREHSAGGSDDKKSGKK